MAWIQVDDSIREHDKIYRMADELNIPDAHAVGLMVCLWTWAATAAPDGDITDFPPRAIAAAAKWKKSAQRFYDTLMGARFIENRDGRVLIRNWEQRATLLINYREQQKENTRKRVQKYRSKTGKETSAGCNVTNGKKGGACNVTETLQKRDVTLLPISTLPISTNNSIAAMITTPGNVTDPAPETEADAALRRVEESFQGIREPRPEDAEALKSLIGAYGADAVLRGIDEAKRTGGKSANYVAAILKRWSEKPAQSGPKNSAPPGMHATYDIDALDEMDLMAPPPEGM